MRVDSENQQIRALVAGSAHIDIIGRRTEDQGDQGSVAMEIGGTACNIASHLRIAGVQVRLLTAWNGMGFTKLVEAHLTENRIDILADVNPTMPLAAFAVHVSTDGTIESSISSCPVESHEFEADLVAQALQDVNFVVVEANLSANTISRIAQAAHAMNLPVFALGVSPRKVDRILPAAGRLSMLFVHHDECEHLMEMLGAVSPQEVASHLQAPVMVTRGERGAMVYEPDGKQSRIPGKKLAEVTNHLGAGSAFAAGFIDGLMCYQLDYFKSAEWAYNSVAETAKMEACNSISNDAIGKLVGQLYEKSHKDNLTGLYSRRFMEEEYPRYSQSVNAVLMVDCDRFKRVNDEEGHATGDQVLRNIAGIIRECLRSVDLAGRWGGDEFVIVLPRVAPSAGLEEARVVANRMREAAEKANLHGVTLSIGLVMTQPKERLKDALRRADELLYEVKKSGRNSIAF